MLAIHRLTECALGVLVPSEAAFRAARRSSAMRCRSANNAVSAPVLGRSWFTATALWLSGSRATNVNSATSDASSPYCFCTRRQCFYQGDKGELACARSQGVKQSGLRAGRGALALTYRISVLLQQVVASALVGAPSHRHAEHLCS